MIKMLIGKEKLDEIGRKLILKLRIDPGCRSKQYSNAYHDGIVDMCKAFQKEIIRHQEQEMLKVLLTDGCVKDDFRELIESTDDCYKIQYVYVTGSVGGTDWDKIRIIVVDTCMGLEEKYYCRYNKVTQEIIWEPKLTNTSWIKEK